jgi:HlyD family secretion protein
MKKILIIVGVIVVIAVIVLVNIKAKPAGKEVEIAVADTGSITSRVESTGELKAKEQVNISAETIARIRRINFAEGDYVKKGALLIELDDDQASANRNLAEANLKQAEQNLRRSQALFDKKLISQDAFDQIKLNYTSAKTSYEQSQDSYLKTKIYAPITGRIIQLNVKAGETVVMGTMNNSGTILMVLADMSSMIAVVDIDETDIPQLRIGQHAEITADALPDSIFSGTVTKIGLMPITNMLSTEQATSFEVEVEMKDFSTTLRPGMNVSADIITSEKTGIRTVPVQAITRRMKDKKMNESVFIVKDRAAELREVTTGSSSDTDIEIKSGIELGDTIIIGPYRILSKLKERDKVTFEAAANDSGPGRKGGGNPGGRRGMRIRIGH